MQPVAQVPVINPLAQVLLNTALTGGAAGSNLNDIISLEMNNILQQMYHDMNIPNPLSLDEIAIANPTLYAQLRSQAESNIQSLIGGNVVQPAGNQPVATIPSSNSHHSRKRPGDFQSNQGNRPASNYNNNRQLGRQGANNSNLPSRGGSGLPPAPPKLTIPPVSSGIPAAKLPSVANVAPLVQAPKNGVKGFVSEAAVVIDVDRVQLITENLTNYKHNSSSIPFPDSDKLVELSNSLLQRLQGYLATIKVPPTLPSILNGKDHFQISILLLLPLANRIDFTLNCNDTGPLPNEPIFAKTNFKAVSTGPVVAAGPVKRAMPVFK